MHCGAAKECCYFVHKLVGKIDLKRHCLDREDVVTGIRDSRDAAHPTTHTLLSSRITSYSRAAVGHCLRSGVCVSLQAKDASHVRPQGPPWKMSVLVQSEIGSIGLQIFKAPMPLRCDHAVYLMRPAIENMLSHELCIII